MELSRVCILSFSKIKNDSRVLRQVEYARRAYDVDVIAYGPWSPQWSNVRFKEIKHAETIRRWGWLRRVLDISLGNIYPSFYHRAYYLFPEHQMALDLLRKEPYALVHANDFRALPVAIEASRLNGAKVLFDAHEFTPGQGSFLKKGGPLKAKYAYHMLQQFGLKTDANITVSEGIANLYRESIGLEMQVIMNAPALVNIPFRPVDPNDIRLVHHGGASRDRRIEHLIEMMRFTHRRYSINLMLIGQDKEYIEELKALSEQVAVDRIEFTSPVLPSEVVSAISKFDIGVYLLPPMLLNNRYALPNKFFEFVVAGLAVAIGPSPEMAKLVKKHDFGVIASSFKPSDLANSLNALTVEQINHFKLNAVKAAREFNADIEMDKLMGIYEELIQ